jgi:hypothetical protein
MNIPTFTKEQQKENLKLAVANLRANPLKAKEQMRDDVGGRCCLCVMSDTAEDICGLERQSLETTPFLPSFELTNIFGIESIFNDSFLFKINGISASVWNDDYDKSHTEIADMLEEGYLQ